MKSILWLRVSWLATFAAGVAVCVAAFAADVPTVSSVSSFEVIVDAAWTNDSMVKFMPPGDIPWNNSLGVIAFEDGFETNFLTALPVMTNASGTNAFFRYPVKVIETTNGLDRVRYYLSAISTVTDYRISGKFAFTAQTHIWPTQTATG